jgi:hypothetical protein
MITKQLITKLKISEIYQETTKSTQLCKRLAQINNQSSKIISNFKSDPESIKIPSSNLELASILKSDPELNNQHKDFKPQYKQTKTIFKPQR